MRWFKRSLLLALVMLVTSGIWAWADYNYTDGVLCTPCRFFTFTATISSVSKLLSANVQIDSAGVEKGTVANPQTVSVNNVNTNGQKTMANSSPVVIASDQAAIPVTGSFGGGSTFGSAFPTTGAAVGLTNGTNMVAWSATTNYGTAPAAIAVPALNAYVTNTNPNGQATMANASPVVIASNQTAVPTSVASQYPSGATPLTASATGTTAATTATLAGVAARTTFICWFSIRANATAAATANSTVTGTITGTLNFTQWTAPAASGLGTTEMIFAPCIPASAVNTAIAVVSAAAGTGGVVSVSAGGYQL